jgi:hypothetical protein
LFRQLCRHLICLNLRQYEVRQKPSPTTGRPLYGFKGKQVKAIGKITLLVTFRDQQNSRIEHIAFDAVNMMYNYNAIFDRGVTNIFSAVLHPGYLCMKLPSAKGIIAVYGDQDLARIAKKLPHPGKKCSQPQQRKTKSKTTPTR